MPPFGSVAAFGVPVPVPVPVPGSVMECGPPGPRCSLTEAADCEGNDDLPESIQSGTGTGTRTGTGTPESNAAADSRGTSDKRN